MKTVSFSVEYSIDEIYEFSMLVNDYLSANVSLSIDERLDGIQKLKQIFDHTLKLRSGHRIN